MGELVVTGGTTRLLLCVRVSHFDFKSSNEVQKTLLQTPQSSLLKLIFNHLHFKQIIH